MVRNVTFLHRRRLRSCHAIMREFREVSVDELPVLDVPNPDGSFICTQYVHTRISTVATCHSDKNDMR